MASLSNYWFPDKLYGGQFEGYNLDYTPNNWAWLYNTGSSGSTLLWNRADGEIVLPLSVLLNSGGILTQIDNLLNQAKRSSPVMTKGLFWFEAPYYNQDPSRHDNNDILVYVYFKFHIDTPWYCYNRDGTIGFYIVPFIDSAGHASGFVDASHWDVTERPDVCQGNIEDSLSSQVSAAVPTVQALLDELLGVFSKETFSEVFVLPGTGYALAGNFSEDADTDAAIVFAP